MRMAAKTVRPQSGVGRAIRSTPVAEIAATFTGVTRPEVSAKLYVANHRHSLDKLP